MKPRFLAFPLAIILTSSAMGGQFVWTGGSSSTWTDPANWTNVSLVSTDTYPIPGSTYASDFLNIRNNGDLTIDPPGNTPGAGAVYDPGAGVTTNFNNGRCFVIGTGNGPAATPPNVKGFASLTVLSGTIAATRTTNAGSEPYMANRADSLLWINGGAVNLYGSPNNFRLIQEGFPGITSTITIDSGSLSCTLLDLVYDAEADASTVFGTGIINLNGGALELNRFNRTAASAAGQTSFTINLNGGTLRCRNANANFLNALTDTQTIVKAGGAVIDTNTFNSTIAEALEHDSSLGASPDGGLTKIGAGNLSLSGASTYTGGTTINAGRIILGNDTGAGTGSITLADTGTELQLGAGRTIANPLVISDTGDLKTILFVNTPGSEVTGPVTINETGIDNFQVRADANCFLTVSGKISGSGGIYKYQSGTVYLTNALNDFTGGAKIFQGTLGFNTGGLGTTGAITMDGGTLRWDATNDQDVSSRIVMVDGKSATFALADGGTPFDISNVTFASAIGSNSTASLVKSGNGTLTLTQPSTYSGGTTLTQGTLGFPAGGLGTTGIITMNGGTLRWQTANTEDVSSRLAMVDAKTATFATNGNNVTFATPIGNVSTGNLAKTGSGILILTGNNSYTGTTTVTGGTLQVDGSLDPASAVSVTGGNLGGNGTVGGSVTVGAAGSIAPGASAGQLSISGGLDVSAMAAGTGKLKFELDSLAGTSDQIAVNGTLTLGVGQLGFSDFQFTDLGGLEVGSYTLIISGGINPGDSFDGTDLSGAINASFDGEIQIDGTSVKLVVTAGASDPYDTWAVQITNGLNLRTDDADGDGFANLEEFLFGSSPIAGNGSLVTTTPGSGNLVLRWLQRESGATYALKQSATLAAGSWTTVVSPVPAMDGNQTGAPADYDYYTVTLPTSGGKLFFRIEGLEN